MIGKCGDGEDCPWTCYVVFFVQLGIGVGILSWLMFKDCLCKEPEHEFEKWHDIDDPKSTSASSTKRRQSLFAPVAVNATSSQLLDGFEKAVNDPDFANFTIALRKEPVFCTHIRSETNFMRSNLDPELVRPPMYPTERWASSVQNLQRRVLYPFLFLFSLHESLLTSLAFGFIAGSIATLIWLILENERFLHGGAENAYEDGSFHLIVRSIRDVLDSIQSSFRFYPVFLMQSYLGYAIVRWRSFITIGYGIQGRIHDIALMTGGSLLRPAHPQSRIVAFRLYRYLNMAHLLCYQAKHPWLAKLNPETSYVRMGLLTPGELQILLPMKNKMRDTVICLATITSMTALPCS